MEFYKTVFDQVTVFARAVITVNYFKPRDKFHLYSRISILRSVLEIFFLFVKSNFLVENLHVKRWCMYIVHEYSG